MSGRGPVKPLGKHRGARRVQVQLGEWAGATERPHERVGQRASQHGRWRWSRAVTDAYVDHYRGTGPANTKHVIGTRPAQHATHERPAAIPGIRQLAASRILKPKVMIRTRLRDQAAATSQTSMARTAGASPVGKCDARCRLPAITPTPAAPRTVERAAPPHSSPKSRFARLTRNTGAWGTPAPLTSALAPLRAIVRSRARARPYPTGGRPPLAQPTR